MPDRDLKQRFYITQKMSFVMQSWNMKGEEFGRFLRANGLSSAEIKAWREQMKDGLEDGRPMERHTKRKLEQRIRLLEEENRQLRVLNELQKKAQALREREEAQSTAQQSAESGLPSSKKDWQEE